MSLSKPCIHLQRFNTLLNSPKVLIAWKKKAFENIVEKGEDADDLLFSFSQNVFFTSLEKVQI